MNSEKLQIRLLSMSKEVFENKSILEVQKEYFLGSFKYDNNEKFFDTRNRLNTGKGSLILFQYDNHIIASAIIKDKEDFSNNLVEGKYKIAYIFEKDSICVFEPITKEEISLITNTIITFSRGKAIDYKYIDKINNLIKEKIKLWKDDDNKLSVYDEGTLTLGVQYNYDRNPKAREDCIKYHGTICQICGFSFEAVYGEMGKGFIHVHHKDKLANKKEGHAVNPINDLIPVCPNCHAMLHSHYYGHDISCEELKNIINENK